MFAVNNKSIGVLALQGDFDAHVQKLKSLGVDSVLVKEPEQLKTLRGLIIPGGESTTMLKFLEQKNFLQTLKNFYDSGGAIFGTCAGAILLAAEVDPYQESLKLLNISVKRNAYGRQLSSAIKQGQYKFFDENDTCECVFIRAPKIETYSDEVEVLVECEGEVVSVIQNRCMAATYHPELSADNKLHQRFLSLCMN